MKKIVIVAAVVIVIAAGVWFYYKNKVAVPPVGTTNTMIRTVPVSNQGPFAYFQLNMEGADGISGEILLNGTSVKKMTGTGFQGAFNQAQDLIVDGENKIELRIDSVAPGAVPRNIAFQENALITIALSALNAQDFPTEKDQAFLINWNAADGNNVVYTFSIGRK
ncbi:MAG TPA: hypothetical protein VK145_01745 [Candidatus Nanoarchaeia archaeon]|nr:hypothetical protein [Candidatus Nanoarchaeia archaeon]